MARTAVSHYYKVDILIKLEPDRLPDKQKLALVSLYLNIQEQTILNKNNVCKMVLARYFSFLFFTNGARNTN